MKNKVIGFWSVVQILIGLLLLGGTVFVSTAVMPKIRSNVALVGDKVSDAADALRAVNASYCQSATNLFAAAENLRQVSTTLGTIGWNLKETGRSLHSDVPLLKQINGVGNSINEIGKGLVNVSCAILAQSNIIRDYRSVGHVKTSALLADYSVMLDDLSRTLKESQSVCTYAWLVCAFGGAVSLLFVMNGFILISIAGLRRD